jgi:hypothetical protein
LASLGWGGVVDWVLGLGRGGKLCGSTLPWGWAGAWNVCVCAFEGWSAGFVSWRETHRQRVEMGWPERARNIRPCVVRICRERAVPVLGAPPSVFTFPDLYTSSSPCLPASISSSVASGGAPSAAPPPRKLPPPTPKPHARPPPSLSPSPRERAAMYSAPETGGAVGALAEEGRTGSAEGRCTKNSWSGTEGVGG